MPRIDVSSSEVRARVADGRPYRFLVPGGGGGPDRAGRAVPVSAEARDRWDVGGAGAPHRGVALDKKARDVVVLDMRDVVSYTDFLVIATGNTERQTKAIEGASARS